MRARAVVAVVSAVLALGAAPALAGGRPVEPAGEHTATAPERGAERGHPVEAKEPWQPELRVDDEEAYRRDKARADERAGRGGADFGPSPTRAEDPAAAVIGGLNQPGLDPNGSSPPDTTGAVGPEHYVEMVNSRLAVYRKSDLSQLGTALHLRDFIKRPSTSERVFDPQIIWDPTTSRWYYVVDRITGSAPSAVAHIAYGWSRTSDPSDLVNGWCHLNIQTGEEFDDYPKLGDNASHLIIGANVFPTNSSGFITSRIWTIPKPANGDTSCPASQSGILSFGSAGLPLATADGETAFTPVPANTFDGATNGYVVAADRLSSSTQIMAWYVDGSGGLLSGGNVAVGAFSVPPAVPQPNSGCASTCDNLDSLDRRLTQAVSVRDPSAGNQQALWTQHTIAGASGRAVVRWYQLLPAACTGSPSCPSAALRQQGEVANAAHHVFNGAVSPTAAGDAAVVNHNVGSGTLTAELRAAHWAAGATLGTVTGAVTLGTSAGSLDDHTCGTRDTRPSCRWGDYAGATPDPGNNRLVWGSNQTIGPVTQGSAHWRTRNFALATAATPHLVHASTAVSDAAPGGDGDGAVEPGERFSLTETVRNDGSATATSVAGKLRSTTSTVTVNDSDSAYADIAPGASKGGDTPFRATVSQTANCGDTLHLAVDLTSAEGSYTVPVSVPTGSLGGATTRTSGDVPKAIPDGDATGVTSTLEVPQTGRIGDVDVTISGITHTYVGDLEIRITSPDGTTVTLVSRRGGSGDDFTSTVFDDEASASIVGASAPFTGSFRPEQALSAFDGRSQQGTWKLTVRDLAGTDTGTLDGWGTTMREVTCAFAGSGRVRGDFDGDGFGDVVVASPGEDIGSADGAGAVHVLYGGSSGLSGSGSQFWHQNSSGVADSVETGDRFGDAVAAGDFDGDGFADLAIGVPGEGSSATSEFGIVHVLYGSSSGLVTSGSQVWHQNSGGIVDAAEANDRFGSVLAAGNFDGDPDDDLAIGVPSESGSSVVDFGVVHVIPGTSGGLSSTGSQRWHQNSSGIADSVETTDRFGAAVAAGDFGGDGRDELVIGVPGESSSVADFGVVHVLPGSSTGATGTGSQFWHQNVSGVPDSVEAGDEFGDALAVGDFDGSGRADLAIGAPGEGIGAADAGAVNVVYSGGSALAGTNAQIWHQDSSGIPDVADGGDRFGQALAAGDFNGDGRSDLAAGVAAESSSATADYGVAHVIYGTSSRLSATNNQLWHQNTSGIADTLEAGDRFGAALATADWNADGEADLMIGAPHESSSATSQYGVAHAIYGTTNRLSATGSQHWHQNSSGVADSIEAGDRFGGALAP